MIQRLFGIFSRIDLIMARITSWNCGIFRLNKRLRNRIGKDHKMTLIRIFKMQKMKQRKRNKQQKTLNKQLMERIQYSDNRLNRHQKEESKVICGLKLMKEIKCLFGLGTRHRQS